MHRSQKIRWPLAAVALAALLGTPGSALVVAEEGQEPAVENKPAEEKSVDVTIGSVSIAVDPETGDLRPLSRAEARELAREMRRLFKSRDLELKEARDGVLSAVAAPNVLSYTVARVGENGEPVLECAPGREGAVEQLTRAAAEPPRPEER